MTECLDARPSSPMPKPRKEVRSNKAKIPFKMPSWTLCPLTSVLRSLMQ